MSKILIHSIVFSPDAVSTAYLYNDIAIGFKNQGYDVSVLTTTPHYNVIKDKLREQPLKKVLCGLYYISYFKGIKVKHIPQKKFKTPFFRILGFIYWHFMAFFLGLFERKINLIISPSPPLTIGFINIVLGKLKGCKTVYNVQEIYPDLMIESGFLKSKIIIRILEKLESFVYNHSSKVTTIDEVFYSIIKRRFKDSSKLEIIPNFVDTSLYKPLSEDINSLDTELFPKTESLKLMYAGNIGYAQDWQSLIDLAIGLRNDDVDFYIIGDGAMKSWLEKNVSINNLARLHLIPYQPREMIPSILAYSDMQFIFMTPETENHGFPSKIYTIMSCSKPILVCSGASTPIVRFLSDKNCSIIVSERDHKKKVDAMVCLLKFIDKKSLKVMGENGMQIIRRHYSKEVVTQQYVLMANELNQN